MKYKQNGYEKGRKWSPNIASGEQYRRKKEREDKYLQEFAQEDRPILVVKKKHAYAGNPRDKSMDHLDPRDPYIKVTEPTHIVDDISQAVKFNENFISRNTFMHPKTKEVFQDASDPAVMYKIEGIEFLPEGFIELDPLLYKDEYTFNTSLDEKMFAEHQKRVKAMRRKQYGQRNQTKMREVTIYVKDEEKAKIIDYLERWYHKNQRKMDENDIEEVARLMQTDYDTMAMLQEAYLRKKHANNVRVLKDYLCEKGMLREGIVDVPTSLKKYFVKSNKPQANVQSKVFTDKGEYSPQYLYNHKQYFKRAKSNKPQQSQRTFDADRSKKKQKANLDKSFQGRPNVSLFDDLSKSFEKMVYKKKEADNTLSLDQSNNDCSVQAPNTRVSRLSSDLKDKPQFYEYDQTLFYDDEISKILEKVKSYKIVGQNDDNDEFVVNTEEVQDFNPVETKNSTARQKNSTVRNEPIDQGQMNKLQHNEQSNKKNNSMVQRDVFHNNSLESNKEANKNSGARNVEGNSNSLSKPEALNENNGATNEKFNNNSLSRNQDINRHSLDVKNNAKKNSSALNREIDRNNSHSHQDNSDIGVTKASFNTKEITHENMVSIPTIIDNKAYAKQKPIVKHNTYKDELVEETLNEKRTPEISGPSPTPKVKINIDSDSFEERKQATQDKQRAVTMNTLILIDHINLNIMDGKQSIPEKVSITSKLEKYNTNPYYKDWAYTRLKNPEDYEICRDFFKNHRGITEVIQKEEGRNKSIGMFIDIYDIVSPKRAGRLMTLNKLRLDSDTGISKKSMLKVDKQPRRMSLVTRSAEGKSKIVQKLRPTLIANEYYHMLVEDAIDENDYRKVSIMTKNENGELLSVFDIPEEFIGQLYENIVVGRINELTGEERVSVAVYNERGETIVFQNLRSQVDGVWNEQNDESFNSQEHNSQNKVTDLTYSKRGTLKSYKEYVDNQGECLSCVSEIKTETSIIRVSKLRPVFIHNEYYHQVVEELIDIYGRKKTTIKTYDEDGNAISERVISNKYLADSYYSKLVEKVISENRKTLILETINNRDEIVLSQPVTARATCSIVDEHVKEVITEVFEDDNTRKISVIDPKPSNEENIVYKEVKSKESFNLEEILQKAMEEQERMLRNQDGKKMNEETVCDETKSDHTKIKNYNRSKSKTMPSKHNTSGGTNAELSMEEQERSRYKTIASKYFKGDILELIEEVEEENSISRDSTAIRPTVVANIYYNDLIYEMAKKSYKQRRHASEPTRKHNQDRAKTISMPVELSESNNDGNLKTNNMHLENENSNQETNQRRNNNEHKTTLNKNKNIFDNSSEQGNDSQIIVQEIQHNESISFPQHNTEVKATPHVQAQINKSDSRANTNETNERGREAEQMRSISDKNSKTKAKLEDDEKSVESFNKHEEEVNETFKDKKNRNSEYQEMKHSNASKIGQNSLDKKLSTSNNKKASNAYLKEENAIQSHIKDSNLEGMDKEYNLQDSGVNNIKRYDSLSIKRKMTEILDDEKDKFSADMIRKISQKMENGIDDELMTDFFDYCKHSLPSNYQYKESVMFVTLFYYFLKKEGLIK